MRPIILALVLTACGHHAAKELSPAETLLGAWKARADEARSLAAGSCWIDHDGDSALWAGKYAAVSDCTDYPTAEVEPGRWLRYPGYVPDTPSIAWSSWSRDMGEGLVAYALLRGDLGALERHRDYGASHDWVMGIPTGDGRSIYTENMIGLLYSSVYKLGGADSAARHLPVLYGTGLVDYEAHLAVQGIYLHGRATELGLLDIDAPLVDIDDDQLDVLKEQAARDARDPLFQSVLALYTGDSSRAVDACLASDKTGYAGEYVRCDGDSQRGCFLAAWLFACAIVR